MSLSSYFSEWDESAEDSCGFCGIPKVLARSKLHTGWSNGPLYYSLWPKKYHEIRIGAASGCNFCALLIDAKTAWNRGDQVDTLGASVSFRATGCELKIESSIMSSTGRLTRLDGGRSDWNLHPLRHTSGDTSSSQAAMTIKSWINTCKNEHKACANHPESHSMPRRILKLRGDRVQLCEDTTAQEPYACLSHCWGKVGPAMKLSPTNIELMKAGFAIEQLPKTFRDAVMLCLSIDIHFLWIDALCIIQGNAEDWHAAAASMADIYAGAAITLAATWSDSSDRGCFSQVQNKHASMPLQEPGLYVRTVLPSFPRETYEYPRIASDDSWQLLKRAWVFQERKLSARVLHVGKEQLYWECDGATLSEDGCEDIRNVHALDLRSIRTDPIDAWRTTVAHYSRLELTYESDRLPAISAVVKRMQATRKGDVYIAGMWNNSLLEDLSWTAKDRFGTRPDETRPTWSWVSVSRGVDWGTFTALKSAVLVRADFEVKGPSHLGYVSNASITLKGPASLLEIDIGGRGSLSDSHCRLVELPDMYKDIQRFARLKRDFL